MAALTACRLILELAMCFLDKVYGMNHQDIQLFFLRAVLHDGQHRAVFVHESFAPASSKDNRTQDKYSASCCDQCYLPNFETGIATFIRVFTGDSRYSKSDVVQPSGTKLRSKVAETCIHSTVLSSLL